MALTGVFVATACHFIFCLSTLPVFTVVAENTPQIVFCLQISVSESPISQGIQPVIFSTSIDFNIRKCNYLLSLSLSISVSLLLRSELSILLNSTLNAIEIIS